jgi:hypothetical protein
LISLGFRSFAHIFFPLCFPLSAPQAVDFIVKSFLEIAETHSSHISGLGFEPLRVPAIAHSEFE